MTLWPQFLYKCQILDIYQNLIVLIWSEKDRLFITSDLKEVLKKMLIVLIFHMGNKLPSDSYKFLRKIFH